MIGRATEGVCAILDFLRVSRRAVRLIIEGQNGWPYRQGLPSLPGDPGFRPDVLSDQAGTPAC